MTDTHTHTHRGGRQRHRQREKQAPRREPDVGLDPRTPGSHPRLKAGAKLLSHPEISWNLHSSEAFFAQYQMRFKVRIHKPNNSRSFMGSSHVQ